MEHEPPSFRDILTGAAATAIQQDHADEFVNGMNDSFFVGPEHTAFHSEYSRRVENYLENQGKYLNQRTNVGYPFANPNAPNYSILGSDTTFLPRQIMGLNLLNEPSHNSNGTEQLAHADLDMNWNSFKSRDFLYDLMASKRNERLFNMQAQGAAGSYYNKLYTNPAMSFPGPSYNQFIANVATAIEGPRTGLQMKLLIIPSRPVHIVGNNLQFQLKVFNVPDNLSLTSSMFEAVAIGPTGKLFPCHIRKGASGEKNTFEGFISTLCEIGYYKVRARMSVPPQIGNKQNFEAQGIISEAAYICVSRNYMLKSRDCFSFQVEFQPVQPYFYQSGQELFSEAWGLTCNKWRNHLYYSDQASNKIHCVDPEGRVISSFSGPYGLKCPAGITFDHDLRRLIVADKDNHRITLFSPEGEYISTFGKFGQFHGDFQYPSDVCINPSNENIVVTDSRNARVQLFDRWGNFITNYSFHKTVLQPSIIEEEFPRACCFDDEGRFLYVTDFNLHSVLKFTPDLSNCTKIVGPEVLRRPQGIVSDAHGNLLVADSTNNCIRILSDGGHLMSNVNEVSNQSLNCPVNLTFLAGGEKLVMLDGQAKLHIF